MIDVLIYLAPLATSLIIMIVYRGALRNFLRAFVRHGASHTTQGSSNTGEEMDVETTSRHLGNTNPVVASAYVVRAEQAAVEIPVVRAGYVPSEKPLPPQFVSLAEPAERVAAYPASSAPPKPPPYSDI